MSTLELIASFLFCGSVGLIPKNKFNVFRYAVEFFSQGALSGGTNVIRNVKSEKSGLTRHITFFCMLQLMLCFKMMPVSF